MSNNRFHVAAACLALAGAHLRARRWPPPSRRRATTPIRTSPSQDRPRDGLRPARHPRRQLLHLPVDQPQRHLRQQRLRDQRQRGLRCRRHPVAPGRRQLQLVAARLELLRRRRGRRLGRVQREQLPGRVRRHHRPAGRHARDIATGTLRFDRLHEDRDDPDESGTTTIGTSDRGNLTRYYRGLLDGQYRHNFARFFTVVGGGVQRLFYDDIGDREVEPPRPLGVWRPRAARLSAVAAHRHLRPGQLQLARLRRGPDRSAASSRSGTTRAGGRRSAPTSTSPASCSARCPSATPSATTTATPIATPAASAATAR